MKKQTRVRVMAFILVLVMAVVAVPEKANAEEIIFYFTKPSK